MVKLLDYRNGKIRISYNEELMPEAYHCLIRRQNVKVKTYPIFVPFSWGLEFAAHMGGRICYGKLAAQVEPQKEKESVHVAVNYTKKNTLKYNSSILSNNNYVYQGLPEEYLESLLEDICAEIGKYDQYPQAKITFSHAANCEVGSSIWFFGIIAKILLHMIYTGFDTNIFDMDIQAFAEQYVKRFFHG